MALKSITIENFKCIGDAVTIPIRPITLLFGKNSSGKSTVLQALLYMCEVYPRFHQESLGMHGIHNVKIDSIDLGDFRSLVHRHELNRKIRIRLEYDLSDHDYTYRGDTWQSMAIESVLSWNREQHIAFVESFTYFLNEEEHFYILDAKAYSHWEDEDPKKYRLGDQLLYKFGEISWGERDASYNSTTRYNFFINHNNAVESDVMSYGYSTSFQPDDKVFDVLKIFDILIKKELNTTLHLGPIRNVPPRNHVYQLDTESNKSKSVAQETTGLDAWHVLARDTKLREKVNHYAQKLALGYSLPQSDRISLDIDGEIMENLRIIYTSGNIEVDKLKKQVLDPIDQLPHDYLIVLHDENHNIKVHPLDVGVGVSQVIPVIAGALDIDTKTFMVEQPELHVHPALQVGLGDLFIDGIQNSDRTMLIETHSEHLLLRLLRRVRETNVRNSKRHEWRQSSMPPLVREMPEKAIQHSEDQDSQDHQLTPDDLSIVYVRPTPEGIKFTPISVTDDGDFDASWPEGFFEERMEELF